MELNKNFKGRNRAVAKTPWFITEAPIVANPIVLTCPFASHASKFF